MILQDFVNKYDGKAIDFDGWYGAQCVDEMNQYCVEVLGISNPISILPGDTAYNIYNNYSGNQFDKIANTPTGVPQPGDIMFWNTTVGSAGHVAIFIQGDQNQFTSFDQNWPVGSVCHKQAHDYKGVAGWLHAHTQAPQDANTQQIIDDLRTARDTNYNNFQAEVAKNTDLSKQVGDANAKTQELEAELSKANSDAKSYLDQLAAIKEDDSNLGLRNVDLGHQCDAFKGQLDALYKALGATTQDEALKSVQTLQTPHQEVVKQYNSLAQAFENSALYKRAPKKTKTIIDKLLAFFA